MEFQKVIDFIRKQYNTQDFIPLHEPRFLGNEKKYLNECIDSTFVSSVGKFVDKFEEETAKYTGAKKAVACVNGTSALHIALKLVGVEENTEVITQALTFIATANAIAYCNAQPVFIDVDKDTLGLSPEKLKVWLEANVKLETQSLSAEQAGSKLGTQVVPINKLTNKPITACIPMHTFGHPCRIDEIVNVCKQYNIPVVEDAAESLGSFYKNQHTGTFGEIGVLSFNGNKILTTGGGGMIITNNEKLAKKAKHLTTQAKVPHKWEFVHDEIAYNYRMPNVNAALGLAQLEQLPKFIESKRKTAKKYEEFFSNCHSEPVEECVNRFKDTALSTIDFFTEPQNAKSNYWLNTILLENKEQRDCFLKYTNENGIMTRPVWNLMNKLPMLKNCQSGDLINSYWLEERLVNIPSSAKIKLMKKPLKVVWLCYFSNDEVQKYLKPLKLVKEYAPWIKNLIPLFENSDEIDLHIVAPHPWLYKTKHFIKAGVKYHFIKIGIPLIGRLWPDYFKFDFWSDYFLWKRRVRKIVKKINPDIIHMHGAENEFSTVVLEYKDIYPVFISVQGIINNSSSDSPRVLRRKKHEKEIYRGFKHFGIRTKTMGEDVQKFNPDASLHWLYDKMPTISTQNEAKKYDLVFFAKLSEEKGIYDLLEAISILKRTKPDISACIIGKGINEKLEQHAQKLNISDNIYWAGFLPTQEDVHKLASQSKISVLPTYFDVISGTIIESLYLKLPVVAYNVGSIHEVNEKEEIISLVNKQDVEGLAQAISYLLDNPEISQEKAEKGYKRINEMFTITDDKIRENLKNIYNDVIMDFKTP